MKHHLLVLLFCAATLAAQSRMQTPPDAVPTETASENRADEPEHAATFKGGTVRDFRGWVMTNLRYPPKAVKKRISGRVTATFVIDTDGSLIDAQILRTPHKCLSGEVLRILRKSPRWTPATNPGVPVKVKYTLPIDFNL